MAGDLSTAGEALVRKWLFTTSSATRPTSWTVALYSAAPDDSGGGTELAGGGYARQPLTLGTEGDANDAEIVFGPATGADWLTATHAGIFANSGALLCWKALSASKTVPVGDSLRFAVGAVTAEFD